MLGPDPFSWRLGRSAQNEVVIEDPSLSRHHARLEFRNGEAVMDLLRELNRNGSTICMVTHDARYAQHADREVALFDGRVVEPAASA